MKQKPNNFLFLVALLLLVLACASPLAAPVSDAPPNVETIVAATFQALTQTPPLESTSNLLPHLLYYLSNDSAQISQVFRMERDGETVTQLTFETSDVNDYDVSPVDGSLVYVWNNQLFTVNTNGDNRAMIVDGGTVDENNSFLTIIRSPVWSPDGQTIAYGYKGLNFYSIVSGQSNRVLDDQIDNIDTEFSIPREMYWPEKYSADGGKLIVTLGYYEGASTAIYYPNGGALVRLNGDGRSLICCGSGNLSADGSFLFDAYPYPGGMFPAGLWQVDTTTGAVATLLSGDYDSNPVEVAASPFPAPDGQLYFFYANVPMTDEMIDSPLLQLVRSGMDGVTGRTVLRSETFENLNEALWAPDASFVVVAMPQNDQIYQGGAAQLFYMDGRPMIPLVQYAKSMKWGP